MFLNDELSEVTVTPAMRAKEIHTISGALQSIVDQAVFRAAAPVQGFSNGYLPTSTLTALTDELGIEFDATVFSAHFIDAWMVAVKAAASTTKPELGPLADQLNHERTHAGLDKLEARVVKLETAALQSAYQQGLRDGGQLAERRHQWFEFHIQPIDKLMNEINEDYRSGFRILPPGRCGPVSAWNRRCSIFRRCRTVGAALDGRRPPRHNSTSRTALEGFSVNRSTPCWANISKRSGAIRWQTSLEIARGTRTT